MYQPLRLGEYNQPANNNGIGMHHFPNPYHTERAKHEPYFAKYKAMGATWVVLLNMDQGTIALAHEYGMTPIIRPPWQIDHGWEDYGWLVQWQVQNYGAAWWQVWNEPSDIREWKSGQPNMEVWAAHTLWGMENVSNNGGYPGIQCLDPSELAYLIDYLDARGKRDLLNKAWVSVHAYPDSHSSMFPFDRRTYRMNPDRSLIRDENGQPIIATIYDREGHSSVMVFLAFNRVMEEKLGRLLPVIVTEGGYRVGDHGDANYDEITDELHARYTVDTFKMFTTGIMPNGEKRPSNVWGFCPWIGNGDDDLGFANQSWFRMDSNPRQTTIDAVTAMEKPLLSMEPVEDPIEPIDPPEEEPAAMDQIEAWLTDMWRRQGVDMTPERKANDAFWQYAEAQARQGRVIVPQPSLDGNYANFSHDKYVLAYTQPTLWCEKGVWQVQEGFPNL